MEKRLDITLSSPFKSENTLHTLSANRLGLGRREDVPYRAPPAVSYFELRLGQYVDLPLRTLPELHSLH